MLFSSSVGRNFVFRPYLRRYHNPLPLVCLCLTLLSKKSVGAEVCSNLKSAARFSSLVQKPTHKRLLYPVCQLNTLSGLRKMVPENSPDEHKFVYPDVRRDDSVVEQLHGYKIPDPYRYLEDPDSDETKAFVEQQNKLSMPYISSFKHYKAMHHLITDLFHFERFSCPFKAGERFYYTHNTGLQNQSVLFVQDSLKGEPRVFFDANLLSADGTVALMNHEFSKSGKYMAYMLSSGGSDWRQLKVRDADTGSDLPDEMDRIKFSCLDWTHDNAGFFYNTYPNESGKTEGTSNVANFHQKLMYHRLGTEQKDDVLCAEYPEQKEWTSGAEVSKCGKYVVLSISRSCEKLNDVWAARLGEHSSLPKEPLKWVKIFTDFKAHYNYIANDGTKFLFVTNENAPRFKIIRVSIDFDGSGGVAEKTDFIAQSDKHVLDCAHLVNEDKLVVHYLEDVVSALYVHNIKSGKQIYKFPLEIGCVAGFSGRKEDDFMFIKMQSFLTPGIIYLVDLAKGSGEDKYKLQEYIRTEVGKFNPEKYKTEQLFYKSRDGTNVSLFVTHAKNMKLDGTQPALLYGYGGFHIAMQPFFSVKFAAFLEAFGGVVAVANIRGGVEYGEDWWRNGALDKKQNCFDDFQAAAEFLIDKKYSNARKITILGGSNGGLLVGACTNQRPDLFGAAIPIVGVLDMTRFHKFTIGHYWKSDYGDPDKEEDLHVVMKYSPLHNIRRPDASKKSKDADGGQYPAVLVVTADHDDRVSPLHSLKYIAELQYKLIHEQQQQKKDVGSSKQQRPLMIRVETKAGHGAGKPVTKQIDENADTFAFIANALKLDYFGPKE